MLLQSFLDQLSRFRKNHRSTHVTVSRLVKLIRASFNDIDAMSEALLAWDVEFTPLDKKPQEGVAGSFIQSVGPDIQYGYSWFAPGLSMFGTPPKGLVTFNVMESTSKRYWVRGHDIDDTMAWVFPVGTELRSVSSPGFKVHTLSATEERIEQIAYILETPLPPASKRPEQFTIWPEFLASVQMRLYEMRSSSEKVSARLADEVLRMLIMSWASPCALKRVKSVSVRAREKAIRRSLDFIETHIAGEIRNDMLLDECNVSERTLQYAFRERFGVTPQDFIRSRRLAKVRIELKHAEPGRDTVGSIATDYGFWHLGRFAEEYRKAFGELPSSTLRTTL